MKVLITGGSGLIGGRITEILTEKNIEVVHLTRSLNSKYGVKTYAWNWKKNEIDLKCFEGVTDIIHLAGNGIANKPWTMKRKHQIIQSRIKTADLIFNSLKQLDQPINSYISASGIGYYGSITTDEVYTETHPPHDDFIAKCCVYWEKSADQFEQLPTRIVKLRTGVVLAKDSGALPKIDKSIRLGIGAPIGNGKQIVPWIHLDDLANVYVEALFDNSFNGIYNAVSPEPVKNETLIKEIAQSLNKRLLFPNVPKFLLKAIYGELSSMVLEGSVVSTKKLLQKGFQYQYPTLKEALTNIYND